jgi:Fur family transcriptional regulator, ferric uptake regulator
VTQTETGMKRHTRQRAEVLALLAGTEEFRSAQQLHAALRDRGIAVGLTTVYRTLQLLAESDEVDQMRLPDGEQLYRRCGRARHHHHLVCRECGATVEVEGPAVERWAENLAGLHGFSDVSHTLEIFGLCPACTLPGQARLP